MINGGKVSSTRRESIVSGATRRMSTYRSGSACGRSAGGARWLWCRYVSSAAFSSGSVPARLAQPNNRSISCANT